MSLPTPLHGTFHGALSEHTVFSNGFHLVIYKIIVIIAAMATAPIATVSSPFRRYANINATVMPAREGISPPAEVNTAGKVMAANTP